MIKCVGRKPYTFYVIYESRNVHASDQLKTFAPVPAVLSYTPPYECTADGLRTVTGTKIPSDSSSVHCAQAAEPTLEAKLLGENLSLPASRVPEVRTRKAPVVNKLIALQPLFRSRITFSHRGFRVFDYENFRKSSPEELDARWHTIDQVTLVIFLP